MRTSTYYLLYKNSFDGMSVAEYQILTQEPKFINDNYLLSELDITHVNNLNTILIHDNESSQVKLIKINTDIESVQTLLIELRKIPGFQFEMITDVLSKVFVFEEIEFPNNEVYF